MLDQVTDMRESSVHGVFSIDFGHLVPKASTNIGHCWQFFMADVEECLTQILIFIC
jgi:hypothetical protein